MRLITSSRCKLAAFELLNLHRNQITVQGLTSPAGPAHYPPTASVLQSLNTLFLGNNQITDEGCAALASALHGGALPALKELSPFTSPRARG